jgi:hypothetical protein
LNGKSSKTTGRLRSLDASVAKSSLCLNNSSENSY